MNGRQSRRRAPGPTTGAPTDSGLHIAHSGDLATTLFNGTTNGVPTASAGGCSGCGFSGTYRANSGGGQTNSQGYDLTQNPITLGSLAEIGAGPSLASSASVVSGNGIHPLGYVLEYDGRGWRRRNRGANSTIGPINLEAISPNIPVIDYL